MMKGQRGMSKAMKAACSEARAGNLTIKEVVRHMGNVFSRASEVSAQEAVYHCLGLPFRKSSRAYQFIPTSPPEDRTFIARQDWELKQLDNDSTDIAYPSLVDKYANRPFELDDLSLAQFVAWYEPIRPANVAPEDVDDDNPKPDESMFFPKEVVDEQIIEEDLEDIDDDAEAPAYKKRRRAKIIRYVRYSLSKDPDNFYREQLLLFHPWSARKTQPQELNEKENQILLAGHNSFESGYLEVKDEIVKVRPEFEKMTNSDKNKSLEENKD
jgi:hypothetical protein